MNSYFLVYLIGYILVIIGIAFGMDAAGLSSTWIIVAVLILAGVGVIYAFGRSQTDEAQKMHARGQGQSSGDQVNVNNGPAEGSGQATSQPNQGTDPNQSTTNR